MPRDQLIDGVIAGVVSRRRDQGSGLVGRAHHGDPVRRGQSGDDIDGPRHVPRVRTDGAVQPQSARRHRSWRNDGFHGVDRCPRNEKGQPLERVGAAEDRDGSRPVGQFPDQRQQFHGTARPDVAHEGVRPDAEGFQILQHQPIVAGLLIGYLFAISRQGPVATIAQPRADMAHGERRCLRRVIVARQRVDVSR